jgi:hypothetical protein
MTGPCEYDNEHSGSMKGGEPLDSLSTSWLLMKGSAPITIVKD